MFRLILPLAFPATFLAPTFGAAATITTIVAPAPYYGAQINSMTNNGAFAGGSVLGPIGFGDGFVWSRTGGTIVTGKLPGDYSGRILAVAENGKAAIGHDFSAMSSGSSFITYWTPTGGLIDISKAVGDPNFIPSAVRNDGSVFGTVVRSTGNYTATWTPGQNGLKPSPVVPMNLPYTRFTFDNPFYYPINNDVRLERVMPDGTVTLIHA